MVTCSVLGLGGGRLWGPYVASKHAVLGLVRTAALEVARDGIRVNALCPGAVDTPMLRLTEDSIDDRDRDVARATLQDSVPAGRYGRPEEMAAAVAWLLSDEASYVTGTSLAVDGEATAGV